MELAGTAEQRSGDACRHEKQLCRGTRIACDAFPYQKSRRDFRCEMKRIAILLALAGSSVLATAVSTPAVALETPEAQMASMDAAGQARIDMMEAFGDRELKRGQYVWRDVPDAAGPQRVVVSLSDQMAYLYRGNILVA